MGCRISMYRMTAIIGTGAPLASDLNLLLQIIVRPEPEDWI